MRAARATAVPWRSALVTGASSGLGEEIARQLSARGVAELLLVARRSDRLETLARELTDRNGTACRAVAADLTDGEQVERVEQLLRDTTVDLLVNNAGFGTSGLFADAEIDRELQEIELNVVALVRLTRAALPSMIARRRGAVMNVSSLGSYQPGPGIATYAATKAYVTSFSESLHEELRGTGVTVTALCPGYTRTEFQQHAGGQYNDAPDFVWMSAETVAREAIDGTAAGKAICIPGVGYKVAATVSDITPRGVRRRFMGLVSGQATKLARRQSR